MKHKNDPSNEKMSQLTAFTADEKKEIDKEILRLLIEIRKLGRSEVIDK